MRRMYSENELKGLVHAYLEAHPEDLVASLGEQDIELGDVTCVDLTASGDVAIGGTLTQTPQTFNLEFPATLASGAVEVDNYYSKMVVFGNTLRIIVSLKLTNVTESTATIGWSIYGTNFELSNLSDDLKSKIYDFNGDNLKDNNEIESWVLVRGTPISTFNDGGVALSVTGGCALARYKNNYIRLIIGYSVSQRTIPAGGIDIINAEINFNI